MATINGKKNNCRESYGLRYIKIGEITYLRMDDVIDLISYVAASEENDVRNRLEELANNIKESNQ